MNKFSIYLAIVFLSTLGVASYTGYVPPNILFTYLIISVVTYLVYCLDKSKAKRNAWRISERKLHFLALFGGWPGATIAQQILRHKTQKTSFRVLFWLTVIINCGALMWLLCSNKLLLVEKTMCICELQSFQGIL